MSTPSKEGLAEFIRWIDFGEELTTEDELNQVARAFEEATKKCGPAVATPDPTAKERMKRHRERVAGRR